LLRAPLIEIFITEISAFSGVLEKLELTLESFHKPNFMCVLVFQFQFPIETRIHIQVSFLEVKIPGESPHYCIHYHWQDWPDRGVPEADLAPVYLLAKVQNTTAPIIVHCSAGIGRTGSIVLIQHSIELLQSQSQLEEISGYLLALRKQRNNSIQTQHQYLYVHQILLLYLKKMRYLDDSVNPYLEQFTADYVEATRGF
ncbi:Protein-tyrosine phosphatase, partial [Ancylostoma caninum]